MQFKGEVPKEAIQIYDFQIHFHIKPQYDENHCTRKLQVTLSNLKQHSFLPSLSF